MTRLNDSTASFRTPSRRASSCHRKPLSDRPSARQQTLAQTIARIGAVVAIACPVTALATVEVFFDTLSNGRTLFDSRIASAGGTVTTDQLTGLATPAASWSRTGYTISATNGVNRSVNTTYLSGSAASPAGEAINMSADGTTTSGLTFTFSSPINGFAVELGDWGTCCYPSSMYIKFDSGAPVLVGTANQRSDVPENAPGTYAFVAAIDDSGTFSTITFYGTGSGDVLYAGGILRFALIPLGALTGANVVHSATVTGNNPALPAAAVIDASPELTLLFAGLSTDAQKSAAASQTLPLLTGSSQVAANTALTGISRVVQARIEINRGLSSGDEFLGDKYFWMKPFGSWADQDKRNGVSGYKADTVGLAFGADATISPATRLGLAFAFADASVDGKSSTAPNKTQVDVYQLLGYGSHSLDEATEISFLAGIGQNRNHGKRSILFQGTEAKSSFTSQTAMLGVGIGRIYRLSETTRITPSVRADYAWIKDKGYTESGAGLLNLRVSGRSTEELILSADAKVSHDIKSGTTLTANAGIGYDVLNERAAITAAFAGAPGASFTTKGIDPSPWVVRAGLGLTSITQSGMEVTARYDAEYRKDFLNQTASVKFRWTF